jgi:hypothetical protein
MRTVGETNPDRQDDLRDGQGPHERAHSLGAGEVAQERKHSKRRQRARYADGEHHLGPQIVVHAREKEYLCEVYIH